TRSERRGGCSQAVLIRGLSSESIPVNGPWWKTEASKAHAGGLLFGGKRKRTCASPTKGATGRRDRSANGVAIFLFNFQREYNRPPAHPRAKRQHFIQPSQPESEIAMPDAMPQSDQIKIST
ncbi:MAG TPA: hypothetical protein DCG06_16015, partial [Deltaproteobacteria bacterium]|nr:hypothetical protein [Deltaproteobacteria bacterium]